MKRFLILLVLLCFFSIGSYAQNRYVTVIVVKANLRGSPSTTGAVVTEVRLGDILKLIEERGSWYLVQSSKYVGWLHGNTIEFGKSTQKPSVVTSIKPAPPPSGTVSPDNPSLRVPDPDSVFPEWLSSENDDGYDIAVSGYDNISLRESAPEAASLGEPLPPPIKRLNKGDRLVILNRTKTRNWVNVIDLNSGKEGWVFLSHVKIYFTKAPKSSVPEFQERRTGSTERPEVTIKNDTDRTLNLRIGDQPYTIGAYTSQTLTLTAGNYKFYASVPRAYPLMGEKYWSNGSLYSWTFYIESK